MAVGDIYERRLRTNPELLGSGTPSSSTFLRGDGTWGSPSVDNIENTLIQMAWDVYSEDRAFDDIYADDLTDQTGIDTVNSTGPYNSGGSYYSPTAAATGTTTDCTSSQLDTTHWSDINSVAITQSTPGDITASAIYHAVSFNGGTTYKVYKSSAWATVAYNNSGTWQYNNAGTLTNASTNSLAGAMVQSTAQSAYRWTKTDIEAMSDANWEATGGWSTSVNTVNWTYRLVGGLSYGSGYATSVLSANGTTTAASSDFSSYYPWKAFNQTASDSTDCWMDAGGAVPHWIRYDFGSGNTRIISSYAYQARNSSTIHAPKRVKLQGSNSDTTNSESISWTDLETTRSVSNLSQAAWSDTYTISNTTGYRHYRLLIEECYYNTEVELAELKLISATPTTPTFTKATFNHDTEHVALDLRTNGWEASANDPTDGYVVLDVEPVDAITNNTDIKTYISIDNGSNYEQVTLESTPFREIGDHDYIRGDISGITARTDKTIRFKVTSHNGKNVKVHGLGGGVKY